MNPAVNRPACLLALTAQCAIALGSLAILALKPPATGAMLLVPVGSESGGHLVDRVLAHGGSLLGAGPIDRSLVIYGRSDAIETALRGSRVLVLAAPFAACGSPPNADSMEQS